MIETRRTSWWWHVSGEGSVVGWEEGIVVFMVLGLVESFEGLGAGLLKKIPEGVYLWGWRSQWPSPSIPDQFILKSNLIIFPELWH